MNIMEAKINSLYFPDAKDPVLKNIDIQIPPGEFIILTGPSGAGKSVFLHCLAGVIPLYKYARLDGEIRFQGYEIPRLPEVAGKIGLVTDNPQNQLFSTTAEEDLAFGPSNMLVNPMQIHRQVTYALDFVGLPGYEKRKPETLSGGEMQRIVLASVLTMDPEILLLDRPADQLDPKGRKDIYQKLRSLCKSQGKTVIAVEEMLEDVVSLADHIWIMDQGTLIQRIKADKDITPISLRKQFSQKRVSQLRREEISLRLKSMDNSTPAVEVKDLSLRYENSEFALENISLKINQGEFVALIGENGVGKTTLTKTFNGLLRPERGSVFINGLNTAEYTTAQLSVHIGYLFQNPLMQVCQSSVEEEISFGLKVKKIPKGHIKNRVQQVLKDFHLEEAALFHPYKLSRGMLQKTALASVLVSDPPILVIDEPTSNMCYEEAREVMDLIDQYHQKGHTVIMITHNLKLAGEYCRRFIVMNKGRLILDTDYASLANYGEVFRNLGVTLAEIPGIGGTKECNFY
ncbi:MAG: ABC transporter ATP-binding protein [Bacillota bacterium]|jgi:energy-coupling factor transporter ATP-binding protein EcfA2